MTITHSINDFLFELFQVENSNRSELKEKIKKFYTIHPFDPTVEVEGDFIHINIDVDRIQAEKENHVKLVSLAERGELERAKELAEELIEQSPNVSEYHRILGQVYSELGDQEEAIDSLIDALKWNPKNEHALLMVGNIFAKYKGDTDTAMQYYRQVLKEKPDDHLALNNIGVQLMEAGSYDEAEVYLLKAHEAEPDYPNTLFALSMLHERQDNLQDAYQYCVKSLKNSNKKDALYERVMQFLLDISDRLTALIPSRDYVHSFAKELEVRTNTDIKIKEDRTIKTAATIQYAEVHNRDHHLVLHKPSKVGVDHLILHELTHLELATEAREINKQERFTSNASNKSAFMMRFKKHADKLVNKGIPEQQVNRLMQSLFDGLNGQIFNAPIDLFIEDRIYNRFEELRPLQLLSMFSLLQIGIEANTKPEILKIAPSEVISSSIVYNLVSALHFKDLFGVDLIADHKPKKSELDKAKSFYEEFQKYRGDKKAGEEYELIQFWAEDLNLDPFFELIPEDQEKQTTADTVLEKIEEDPYGADQDDPSKERKMQKFLEKHATDKTNMAVSMYMVSAIQFFEALDENKIKEIAFDFAKMGTDGIDPNKEGYHVPSIPNSSFSGYKTLAYFYVSWALSMPQMVSSLGLPFDKEFSLAKQFIEK